MTHVVGIDVVPHFGDGLGAPVERGLALSSGIGTFYATWTRAEPVNLPEYPHTATYHACVLPVYWTTNANSVYGIASCYEYNYPTNWAEWTALIARSSGVAPYGAYYAIATFDNDLEPAEGVDQTRTLLRYESLCLLSVSYDPWLYFPFTTVPVGVTGAADKILAIWHTQEGVFYSNELIAADFSDVVAYWSTTLRTWVVSFPEYAKGDGYGPTPPEVTVSVTLNGVAVPVPAIVAKCMTYDINGADAQVDPLTGRWLNPTRTGLILRRADGVVDGTLGIWFTLDGLPTDAVEVSVSVPPPPPASSYILNPPEEWADTYGMTIYDRFPMFACRGAANGATLQPLDAGSIMWEGGGTGSSDMMELSPGFYGINDGTNHAVSPVFIWGDPVFLAGRAPLAYMEDYQTQRFSIHRVERRDWPGGFFGIAISGDLPDTGFLPRYAPPIMAYAIMEELATFDLEYSDDLAPITVSETIAPGTPVCIVCSYYSGGSDSTPLYFYSAWKAGRSPWCMPTSAGDRMLRAGI